jgi:hypothetical protein
MSGRKLLICLLALFIALSFSDLFLTGYLLRKGNGFIYEGNPIANAWLYRFGWPGLVVFKALAMWVVGAVAIFLMPRRPRLSAFVLIFSCLIVGAVLWYSISLARSQLAQPAAEEERVER